MIIKICATCKENKPINEYYINKRKRKDGSVYEYVRNECKKCTAKRSTKWGEQNREKKREHWRRHSALPHKRELQKRKAKEAREKGEYLDWLRNNKDKVRHYRLSRAHKIHQITNDEWLNCKEYFDFKCAYCGLDIDNHYVKYLEDYKLSDFHKEHVDHEGSNDILNCVPSCKSCNSSKHVYTLEEWYTKDNPNFNEDRLIKIHKWLTEDVYKLNNKIKEE